MLTVSTNIYFLIHFMNNLLKTFEKMSLIVAPASTPVDSEELRFDNDLIVPIKDYFTSQTTTFQIASRIKARLLEKNLVANDTTVTQFLANKDVCKLIKRYLAEGLSSTMEASTYNNPSNTIALPITDFNLWHGVRTPSEIVAFLVAHNLPANLKPTFEKVSEL